MKKMIFSALAIALCSAFVACDKIDNGCKCTTRMENGDMSRVTYKAEVVKGADAKSCSDFAKKMKENADKYAKEATDSSEKVKSIVCRSLM